MKSIKIILFFLIILAILVPKIATAETNSIENQIQGTVGGLENQVDQTRDNIENIGKNQAKGEFLANEWTSFFRTSKAFSWIYKLNPIFKFFIGQEFSISWKFTTGVLIWLIILFTILGSLDLVFDNKLFNIAFGSIMSALISQLAVPVILDQATELVKKGSEKAGKWINGITILALILLIILIKKSNKNSIFKWGKSLEKFTTLHPKT